MTKKAYLRYNRPFTVGNYFMLQHVWNACWLFHFLFLITAMLQRTFNIVYFTSGAVPHVGSLSRRCSSPSLFRQRPPFKTLMKSMQIHLFLQHFADERENTSLLCVTFQKV